MSPRLLGSLVVFAVVVLVAAPGGAAVAHGESGGPAAVDAPACGTTANNVTFVETGEVVRVNATGVVLEGEARVEDFQPVTGWFEYRAVGAEEWRTTGRETDEPDSCGRVRFERPVDGLDRNGTYEFRAVVTTGNDTARGNVTRFEMAAIATPERVGTTDASTVTPTPDPCPSFRGASGLCTGTPTPSPTPAEEEVEVDVPDEEASTDDWLGGLLPVLGWFALVAILAPLILGGLVGADSLRGDD